MHRFLSILLFYYGESVFSWKFKFVPHTCKVFIFASNSVKTSALLVSEFSKIQISSNYVKF